MILIMKIIKWVNTSAPEIRALFGINIMMGINSLPQYKMYWHKDMFLGNDGIERTMPISRYEKFTHRHEGAYDKLFKIRPIITMTKETFKECYNLVKNQTVDEAMIAYKGHMSYIQDLPAKPIKHVKLWMRCDSESAYFHEYDVYLGKLQNSQHGLAYDVDYKIV